MSKIAYLATAAMVAAMAKTKYSIDVEPPKKESNPPPDFYPRYYYFSSGKQIHRREHPVCTKRWG